MRPRICFGLFHKRQKALDETLGAMTLASDELVVKPNAGCGDQFFHEDKFVRFYRYHGIRPITLGPNTPWPNRAEAGVKLFKHRALILIESLRSYEEEMPALRHVSV